jgi:hypothetical protein
MGRLEGAGIGYGRSTFVAFVNPPASFVRARRTSSLGFADVARAGRVVRVPGARVVVRAAVVVGVVVAPVRVRICRKEGSEVSEQSGDAKELETHHNSAKFEDGLTDGNKQMRASRIPAPGACESSHSRAHQRRRASSVELRCRNPKGRHGRSRARSSSRAAFGPLPS